MRKSRADSGNYSVTTGYLILSGLSVVMFALALQDPMFLVFGIPILMLFVLGASIDRGSPGEDLAGLGWSGKNLSLAVPLGIGGGLVALVIGGVITRNNPASMASIVPDFSSAGVLATASVVPPMLGVAVNIASQWLVISPSEEALARVLAPYAGMAVFKNGLIAYVFGALFWTFIHAPTFIIQGVTSQMYVVLGVIAAITVALLLFTNNLMSAIIAHSTFNTGVILMGQGLDRTAFFVVAVILLVLTLATFASRGGNRHAKTL